MTWSMISPAAGGALFAGETAQLGRLVPKFSPRPRKLFSWLRPNEHQQLHQKSLLQIPRNRFFSFRPRGSPSHSAFAKKAEDGFFPEVSDDNDEMLDDLFKKYGKVVFRSNDQRPPSAEVDDDAKSLAFAMEMAKIASDGKAADLKLLFVKPLVNWARFFIIGTAFSHPQIYAIGTKMRDLAEEKYGRFAMGDVKPNSWYFLDFDEVAIHIFMPEERAYYNLDEYYANAPSIELPFENQPPFQR